MSGGDNGSNGAQRYNEYDAIAEVRREIDEDLKVMERRIGLIEKMFDIRLDSIEATLKKLVGLVEGVRGDMAGWQQRETRLEMRVAEIETNDALGKPRPRRRKKP